MMSKPTSLRPELDELLKRSIAAFNALSPEEQAAERRAQCISWVYGNLALDGVDVTKEQVADMIERRESEAPELIESGEHAKIAVPDDGWRPIDTFDNASSGVFDFWLEWADECARLNAPLRQTSHMRDQQFRGIFRTWSAVYQATHWRPLPPPPSPDERGRDG